MTDEVKSILHRVWGMKADAMMRGLEVQPRLFGAEGEAVFSVEEMFMDDHGCVIDEIHGALIVENSLC